MAKRNAVCDTFRMAQIVARVDDELAEAVDDLVQAEVVESRSDAVRIGLQRLVDEHRRAVVGRSIVAAYEKEPQTQAELAGIERTSREMIAEEPW